MHRFQQADRPASRDRRAAPRHVAGKAARADQERGALQVQRAILELRAGRDVQIIGRDGRLTVAALDAIDPTRLQDGCVAGAPVELLLSAERAAALDQPVSSEAVLARLPPAVPPPSDHFTAGHAAWRLAGIDTPGEPLDDDEQLVLGERHDDASAAALELARQARLQPALVLRHASVLGERSERVDVTAADVQAYSERRGRFLDRTGSARVQLAGASDATFVAFRERFGDAEHAAIFIGSPDTDEAVTVRLHSACFTGDLFGSLRCDCGEQLKGAVQRLLDDGGGVILYLDQEGRGIGLGNKLRAYRLQAAGMDTIDADRQLGFGADGRDFTAARAMLTALGIDRVRLLTNNPAKVAALDAEGLQVVERLPLSGSINPHNAQYLATKRDRGGHLPSVTAGGTREPDSHG